MAASQVSLRTGTDAALPPPKIRFSTETTKFLRPIRQIVGYNGRRQEPEGIAQAIYFTMYARRKKLDAKFHPIATFNCQMTAIFFKLLSIFKFKINF